MKTSIRCKHFNGTRNESCKAGVKYEDVTLGKGTSKVSLPCIEPTSINMKKHNELGAKCDKCEMPTQSEIEAEEREMEEHMQKTMKVRAAIVAHIGGPWKLGDKGVAGTIDCPACLKSTVRFSRAGCNGHIHAHCGTQGCVSWME